MSQKKKEKETLKSNSLILEIPTERIKKCFFYIPAYIRIDIHHITELSLENLNGKFKLEIMFEIDITGLPNYFVDIMKDNLYLTLAQEEEPWKIEKNNFIFIKERYFDRDIVDESETKEEKNNY